jgi:hypothetical protein
MLNTTRKYYSILAVVTLVAMIHYTYFFFLKPLIMLEYEGLAPTWFHNVTHLLYPRFDIEKSRFNLAFFLSKTDQIVWRGTVIASMATGLFFAFKEYSGLRNYLRVSFLDYKVSTKGTAILIKVFYIIFLFLGAEIILALWDNLIMSEFYKPIPILKLLPFPSRTAFIIISALFVGSCVFLITGIKPLFNACLSIIVFLYLVGLVFSFEKTDHGYATFTYAALLMPLLIYANKAASKNKEEKQNGWALKMMYLLIGIAYLQSGLEKILISHWEWVRPETFKSYLLLHETSFGMWVFHQDVLTTILPFAALCFQLGFISTFFIDKAKWFFIPAGILFHIGTYHLFDAGGYYSPWILVYVVFVSKPGNNFE